MQQSKDQQGEKTCRESMLFVGGTKEEPQVSAGG